ncbi:MAG: MarR family transcriptional regulator [Pseudomonadota bacterium]
MRKRSKNHELLFMISDVGRLLRTYADQRARLMGMTRAQWSVLLRLERNEGLIQADLADVLDIQPITLTRLIDRLCDNGLVERRPDPNDRRAKFLFLTPAARPLLDRITTEIEDLSETILAGVEPAAVDTMMSQLGLARDNLKRAIQRNNASEEVKRYG